jgi:hypothetical protein
VSGKQVKICACGAVMIATPVVIFSFLLDLFIYVLSSGQPENFISIFYFILILSLIHCCCLLKQRGIRPKETSNHKQEEKYIRHNDFLIAARHCLNITFAVFSTAFSNILLSIKTTFKVSNCHPFQTQTVV